MQIKQARINVFILIDPEVVIGVSDVEFMDRAFFCEQAFSCCGSDVRRIDVGLLQRKVNKITNYKDVKF